MVVSTEEVIVPESEHIITKKSKKKKRKGEKKVRSCDAEKNEVIPSISSEEPVKKKTKTKSQISDSFNNDDNLNSASENTKMYDENTSNTEKNGKRKKKKKAKHVNDSAGDKPLNATLESDQMSNVEAHSEKIAEITTDNNESTLNKIGKKKKIAKNKQRDSGAEEVTLKKNHTPTMTGDENLKPDDGAKKSSKEIKKKKTKTLYCASDVEPEQTSLVKSLGKDQEEQNPNPIQVGSSENVENNPSKNGSDLEKIKKKKKKEKRRSEDKALKSISDDVRSDQDTKKIKGPTDVENQTDTTKPDEIDPNFGAMNSEANSSKTKKKKKKDQKENNSESNKNNTDKDTKSLGKDTASQKTEESKNEIELSIGEIKEPDSKTFSSKSRKRKKDKKVTQGSKGGTDDQNIQNEKSSVTGTPETVTSVPNSDQSTRNKKKKKKVGSKNRSQDENVKTDPPDDENSALATKTVDDGNADELDGQIEPENTSESQSAKKKKKSQKRKKKQGEKTEGQNADESVAESKANKKSTKRKVESTILEEASKDDDETQSREKKKKVKKEKLSAVFTPSIESELTSKNSAGEEMTARDLPKKKKRKKAQSDEAEMNGKTAAENEDGATYTGQSKELDQNPKQECSTANDRLGQWKTAKLSSSAQQDKFVRLLGGTKLAPAKKDSPASTLNGGSILSRLSGVWKPPPGRKLFRSLMNREKKTFSSVALDEKESEELATNLEKQYNKTLDFNLQKRKEGNAAKGLGFQEDPAKGKKHYIDINKVNSIALE